MTTTLRVNIYSGTLSGYVVAQFRFSDLGGMCQQGGVRSTSIWKQNTFLHSILQSVANYPEATGMLVTELYPCLPPNVPMPINKCPLKARYLLVLICFLTATKVTKLCWNNPDLLQWTCLLPPFLNMWLAVEFPLTKTPSYVVQRPKFCLCLTQLVIYKGLINDYTYELMLIQVAENAQWHHTTIVMMSSCALEVAGMKIDTCDMDTDTDTDTDITIHSCMTYAGHNS